MSDKIKSGEWRWYRWGTEPPGKVHVWTVNKKDRSVEHRKRFMDEKEAREKNLVQECPYP
jgi:hypothetical protein